MVILRNVCLYYGDKNSGNVEMYSLSEAYLHDNEDKLSFELDVLNGTHTCRSNTVICRGQSVSVSLKYVRYL
jgi:hypothetical protein